MQHKTAKISDLIKLLQTAQEEYGDRPIVLSADSELNSIGTINTNNELDENITEENGIIILYPHIEGLYLDDIKGCRQETVSDYEETDEYEDNDDDLFDDYDEDE